MTSSALLTEQEEILAARRRFPCGLSQPAERFRFSLDALLLAGFCRLPKAAACAAADLGAGCGVAGLALALRFPERAGLALWSLDIDPAMVAATQANAAQLGITANALQLDLRTLPQDNLLPAARMDLVLANPPYRAQGQGRLSPNPARAAALVEQQGALADFAAAAAYLLKPKSSFFLIYLAERLTDALDALRRVGLEPKRLLPVLSKAQSPAKLVLIEARKQGRPGLRLEPPLVLHQAHNGRLSAQALAFCPFLACSASREEDCLKDLEQNRDHA